MTNGLLDFGDDDGVSGFVGGGVGVARVDYSQVRAFSNQAAIVDGADDTFAWQLIAGLRYPVSDDVDVMLMYRHFETQDIRVETFTGRDADAGFGGNSILIGFTYDFFSAPFGPH
jgi:opacity protein-like surface antigen